MKLTTKGQLNIVLQAIKKLIERIEARFPNEDDAIDLATEMKFVSPTIANDGAIYTDENGAIYSL